MFKKNNLVSTSKTTKLDLELLAELSTFQMFNFHSFYELKSYLDRALADFQGKDKRYINYTIDTDVCLRGIVRIFVYKEISADKTMLCEFVKENPLAWENIALKQ